MELGALVHDLSWQAGLGKLVFVFQTHSPLFAFVLHCSSIVYELHAPLAIQPATAALFAALTVHARFVSTATHLV